jgi:hypothetical protein
MKRFVNFLAGSAETYARLVGSMSEPFIPHKASSAKRFSPMALDVLDADEPSAHRVAPMDNMAMPKWNKQVILAGFRQLSGKVECELRHCSL